MSAIDIVVKGDVDKVRLPFQKVEKRLRAGGKKYAMMTGKVEMSPEEYKEMWRKRYLKHKANAPLMSRFFLWLVLKFPDDVFMEIMVEIAQQVEKEKEEKEND